MNYIKKNWIFIAGICFLVISAAITNWFETTRANSQERLSVRGEPSKNFGAAKQGEILRHTFTIINNSNYNIEINKVIIDCGCTTTADLNGKMVPAGSAIELPVVVRTENKSGLFKSSVIVAYSEISTVEIVPKSYTTRMILTGQIIPKIQFHPKSIDFGKINLEAWSQVVSQITVEPSPEFETELYVAGCKDNRFIIHASTDPNNKKITFNVGLSEKAQDDVQAGRIQSEIDITTETDKSKKIATIPIFYEISVPFSIEPKYLLINSDDKNKRFIYIRAKGSAIKSIKIKSVESTYSLVDARVSSQSTEREQVVEILLKDMRSDGVKSDMVRLNMEVLTEPGSPLSRVSTVVPIYLIPKHRSP